MVLMEFDNFAMGAINDCNNMRFFVSEKTLSRPIDFKFYFKILIC